MSTRPLAKMLLALGLLLLGYSFASASAITGSATFGFGNSVLQVQVFLAFISFALIMTSCILFLLKKESKEAVQELERIRQEAVQDDRHYIGITQEEIKVEDIHEEL